jgi:HD-GYP domain-containing protein (c-di-GMP phosphodiesterase class II)
MTLDKKELFPAGSKLSEESLKLLISQVKATSYKTFSLIKYGSIEEDLLRIINTPPYDVIFSDKKEIEELLYFMQDIHVIFPVVQSLDYFKYNDLYTYRHILIVFALFTLLSKTLMSDSRKRIKEAASAPIHDIGKICIPLHILNKSDPLTHEERKVLEHHSIAGYVLLSYYFQDPMNIFCAVARDHHERRDGSGYPQGLRLKNRTVEIIATCDIYDALISSRPYRSDSYDNRTAIEELTEMGKKNVLGWEAIKALVSLNRKDKPPYSECQVSDEKRGTPPVNNNYGVFDDENV